MIVSAHVNATNAACVTISATLLALAAFLPGRAAGEGVLVPDDAEGKPAERQRPHAVDASAWLLEHAQDLVSVLVGAVLIALAGAVLVSGIVSFFTEVGK